MNLRNIREEAWDWADDYAVANEDHLWKKEEMNRYINRVYRRIASETLCIQDSNTAAVCRIASDPIDYTTYVSGTDDYYWANTEGQWLYHKDVAPYLYMLHPSILKIEEVKWTTRQWKLTKVESKKWQVNPYWEQVVGMPTEYATDLHTGKIALNFRSESSDILKLVVKRMPLVDLIQDGDIPEFRAAYHEFFLDGVLYMMYQKQDSQCFDKDKADWHKAKFDAALDEIKQEEADLQQTLGSNGSMDAFR